MVNNTESKNRKREPINIEENPYYIYNEPNFNNDPNYDFWNIDETISELSYLTHNFFRYYGKFPSKVGKLIIEKVYDNGDILPERDIILDNYSGSGTSLVEAKIAGFDSVGIDINPLAVLASRVKTNCLNVKNLSKTLNDILVEINLIKECLNDEINLLNLEEESTSALIREKSNNVSMDIIEIKNTNKDITKWFSEESIQDLSIIKFILKNKSFSTIEEKEFFLTGFLAIIRRVSVAYDAEVRPHVNKRKRPRDVFQAFTKKVIEMIERMEQFNQTVNNDVKSNCFICDNRKINDSLEVQEYIQESNKKVGLVISHPPYLNAFDYIPVFKLEFMWSIDFPEVFRGFTHSDIKKMEIKSHPANTQEKIIDYFENHRIVYQQIYELLKPNGICAIVIGDCTVNKRLLKVHKILAKICEEIGFTVEEIIYRSTHYGLGKYAYDFRADYHGDENSKKDGILVLRKR